ncbi:MAG: redoxin domain-containing protein [Thermomicrobiaceae bacterium]
MPETLEQGMIFPDFTLDDIHGNTVSSRSFYMRRILVVALVPNSQSSAWSTWLRDLSSSMNSVDEADAVALVILPAESLPDIAEVDNQDQRVRILVDPEGKARERFKLPPSTGQLIVANQHGVVYHTVTGNPDDPGFEPDEIPGWVEFVACRCS